MDKNIHPTCIIEEGAKIGKNAEIGAFSLIHRNVIIGENCKIGAYCELGIETPLSDHSPLIIQDESTIRSHSIFYESSQFGKKLVTGHRVTVRENTIGGENLQIGTVSDIQGDCSFGDYVRLHSNVHIGKKSKIGNFVWIFPYVVLTNDPHPPSETLLGVTVNDFAVIATMSVVLPGVTIGSHSLVAAHACVNKDVPENVVVGGTPAKILTETKNIFLHGSQNEKAYPWINHFHRGYPDHIIKGWMKEKL